MSISVLTQIERHNEVERECVCVCVRERERDRERERERGEQEEPGFLRGDNRLLPPLSYLSFPAVRAADPFRSRSGIYFIHVKLHQSPQHSSHGVLGRLAGSHST